MAGFALAPGEALLVAARGRAVTSGLWRWRQGAGGWQGELMGAAHDLSALAVHPHLPVVYATAGEGAGRLIAWRLGAGGAEVVADVSTFGIEPAHLAIDPAGRVLIVANYQDSSLAIWRLAADGGVAGEAQVVKLAGHGPDPERQAAAHPHQVLFRAAGTVVVIDLGADLVRQFHLDAGAPALRPAGVWHLPAGSGPRHGVFLAGGRMALAAELGNALFVGSGDDWRVTPATALDRPGHARFERNYPGDLAAGPGGMVHLANRSLSTLASFDLRGPVPRLAGEVECGVDWPQHLLVNRGHVLVAGWDSGRVVAHPLQDGLPRAPEVLFDCAGACWIARLGPEVGR